MKTMLLSLFAAAALHPLFAQNELASAIGVPPRESTVEEDAGLSSEPAIAAFSHTVDDMAVIALGRGLRKAVTLQVLTPGTGVLIQQEIPAGQSRVRIDLGGLPDGAYTVRIDLGGRMWVKQIVKG